MTDHTQQFARQCAAQVFPYLVVKNIKTFLCLHFYSWIFVQLVSSWFSFLKLQSLIANIWSQLNIFILINSIPEKGRTVCPVSRYIAKLDESYWESEHDQCACSWLNFYKDYLEHNCYLCVILIKQYIPKHIKSEQIKTQVDCYSH